jgi:hypothetical protein
LVTGSSLHPYFSAGLQRWLESASPVLVIKPHDVILAEIRSALNLDQFERNLARIGEAMGGACRDVRGLVLLQQGHSIADGHFGGALNDNPMLGSVVMFLQG